MLNRVIIVLGFLAGSVLAAWGASSTLSGLSAGGSISGTDLFYDVQTPGVGGVKVTGTQFLSFVFGNVTGNCTATVNGIFTCSSFATNSVTSIAAGTNITTSGTATNTTVNVIATPTFTSVNTTLASVIGWLTAPGVNMQTASIIGNLTGSTAQFTNTLTGTSAVFQTMTVNNLTPTGPNCLQETGGVIQATNATCGGGGGSVAGANTNVQFNNSSAFGGDAGFIYGSGSGQVGVKSAGGYGLSSLTSATTATLDTVLFRDAATSVLALGDFATNTNATEMHFYNTTDNVSTNVAPTNYERGVVGWVTTPNVFTIGTQNGGTGSVRNMKFIIGAVNKLDYGVTIAGTWEFGSHIDVFGGTIATNAAGLSTYNTGVFQWSSSGNAMGGADTVLTRLSPNVVGIGTTSGDSSGTLKVAQISSSTQTLALIASGSRAQTLSNTATTFAAALNAPAIAQLGATTTGYACWTTGTGAISEDSTACLASLRRLKKDIVPFTDATAELMALKPSQFQWKDPIDNNQRGQQLGFVAEDVHDVDARLATYDGSGALHGWRQDAMIAALVRGFQEQQAIIQRQQAEIDELKQGRLP